MKKVFLIGALFALFFTSCKKDDGVGNLQIGGIEVPQSDADNPALAGSSVTIKGDGFTEASEIWFRVATKSTSDVKAEVTAVTKTEITFVVPDVVGSQSIVLKQDGKEQILGEMSFAKEEVYVLSYGESVSLNKYDSKTGEFVKQEGDYTTFEIYETYEIPIASNNVLYYVGYHDISEDDSEEGVVKYDLKTNLASFIKRDTETRVVSAVVLINNKLHALIFDETTGYEVVEMSDNGTETVVKKFGNIDIEDDVSLYHCIYDKATNSILIGGEYYSSADNQGHYFIASFSLESGTIKISDDEIDGENLFSIGSKIYSDESNSDDSKQTFFEINPVTLQKGANVKEVIDGGITVGIYSESLNTIFYENQIDDDNYQSVIYDISAKTERVLKLDVTDYTEFFINRITE